ncbi:hypothetical protein [Nocardioides dongkuii]|uniref:hypothetical protein n=1 Tax=Nocardioides dongkuii TaxID=2760089 RepID=UPI0029D41238|nr:hypothetical protein [Nocardioides dongkuii]
MSLLDDRFEVVARHRPVDLVVPGDHAGDYSGAPYVAVTGDGPLTIAAGDLELTAWYDGGAGLTVATAGRRTEHRSRRHHRAAGPVDGLGLALTGSQATVLTHEAGQWVARGRVDLEGRVDVRDEALLADLRTDGGPAGGFGQLGLRDVRLVTHADGSPYRLGRLVLLTATSAGPGFFATAHTSVWSLDPDSLDLAHRADLFFRRPGGPGGAPGVHGDHATHLVRDQGRWLVATSSWGDFDRRRPVRVLLAESSGDLLTGRHVLDARVLPLPTDGLTSVGVWDPHLVRTDEGWLVGYVSARRYFSFHPVLAGGPSLDELGLLGADRTRRSCEGTTLHRVGAEWRVLASDRRRAEYPVYDLALTRVGRLAAPYPSNIPWPTVVEPDGESGGRLLVTFDGTPYGGPLTGYGTHGDLVVMRAR